MSPPPIYTAFTATYNRKNLLPRCYKSLLAQTFKDFEWLIVDDGSTDGTRELVDTWIQENKIRIRYYSQPNKGKHAAYNLGVPLARGKYLLGLDSDDALLPTAMERMKLHFEKYYGQSPGVKLMGINVHAMTFSDVLIGNRFKQPVKIASRIDMWKQGDLVGDKIGFYLTEVLREEPFPEFPGENFIPEGIVWNRLAKKYKILWIDEILFQGEYTPGGLTSNIRQALIKSPKGARLYYLEEMSNDLGFGKFLRNLIHYLRFSFHSRTSLMQIVTVSKHPGFAILLSPLGLLLYGLDRYHKGK